MKAEGDPILQPDQARYLESLLPARDPVAAAIEAHAREHKVPVVDPEVGRFLHIAASSIDARRILEVGTATGYSGLWLARALPPEGRLITIDVDPERQRLARQRWTEAGVAGRIETIQGAALDVLPTLAGPFDLLFVDAVKTEYRAYLDLALPLLRPGALVIADNVLWGGRVARGVADAETRALREFNRYAMDHPRLTAVVLPLGDGLLYAVVRTA